MANRKKKNEQVKTGRRVTQRDIAAALGISLTQVSFALRGSPRASKALQERVRKKAEEMGYVPDERMASLARYRKDSKMKPTPATLAWLNLSKEYERFYLYQEYMRYWKGATAAARRLGFELQEVVAKGRSPQQLREHLKMQGIKGILVTPFSDPSIPVDELLSSDFTLVRFGLEMEKPVLHSVTANHVSNGELAFRKTREKGYKRIGFVSERQLKLPFGAGIFWEQKECPKSEQVPLLLFSSKDEREQRKLLAAWIEKEQPDAIITDMPGIPAMLVDMGIRVPEDVALATTSILDTSIDTGIDQHSEEIGRLALLTLVSLMNATGSGSFHIQNQTLVEGKWVDGSMMPSRIPGDESHAVPARTEAVIPARAPVFSPVHSPAARRVTQRDIAKAIGVSHMTVSLALRNDPRASAETRGRIQQKAAEMGYLPDPMLSAMGHYCRTSRATPVMAELAWFNLWREPAKLYSYREFEQYWKGAVESAWQHGYRLEEYRVKDMPLPRLDGILKTRNIRGILVPPSPLPGLEGLNRFPWRDYAVVQLGVTCPVPLPHSVGADDVANSALALEKIREKGYRRIAFVGDRALQRAFGAGFYWAQRMLPVQMPEFFLPLKEPARHRIKLAAWIRKERPDAILTDNGELPEILADLGIRVPEDIALATTTLYDTPIDAGIDHHSMEIGRMSILSLMAHMKDPHATLPEIRSQVHVAGDWVDGGMMPFLV